MFAPAPEIDHEAAGPQMRTHFPIAQGMDEAFDEVMQGHVWKGSLENSILHPVRAHPRRLDPGGGA